MTKWAMYFMLTIAMTVGGAVASKPGQDDVEYEMGKVALKGYVPSTPFIPPLYVPSPEETQAAEAFWSQASKMYYDEDDDLGYFLLQKPHSLVVFGEIGTTESEAAPSYLKIGEIFLPQDDADEEQKFINVFSRIESQGSVIQLTSQDIKFYKKISYSESVFTLTPGMSIGVMCKCEGQEDTDLMQRMNFKKAVSVLEK